jgi:hypothetical protein
MPALAGLTILFGGTAIAMRFYGLWGVALWWAFAGPAVLIGFFG